MTYYRGYLRHWKKISSLLSGYYYFIPAQVPSIFSHLRHVERQEGRFVVRDDFFDGPVPLEGAFVAQQCCFVVPVPPKSCSVARQEMRGVTEEVVGSVTANSEISRTNYSGRV